MTKETLKEKIIFFIESSRKKSFSMEEIAQGLGLEKSEDFKLLVQNELIDYLLKYQKEVDDLYEKMVKEYKIKWNVTEELKQKDQMKWVQMMNNIKNCVNEIIIKEIIFIDI